MNVLFDTNVVLDVLLDREPHVHASAQALALVERGEIGGSLCATTVTTLFYLCDRTLDRRQAHIHIATLLKLFDIAQVNRMVLANALDTAFADFEDAVLHEAARHAECQCIVTRNVRDFAAASMPVYTPTEFLLVWQKAQGRH
ncbi:PIN domain-containing protein [Pseudothauera nasutitermitis]|uniref:PIN domain-containing protein n=1 Tax=Pseudothauera nasutitermitis TaxID=2565930 RepID=A0A4S4AT16_9RHOO|nr:PIN domain-containing protein [Pseudothauera nasutitermitis]THF63045.1 PIN domain-containing protein [Pseudothauera nasutitermitis]